MITHVTTPLAPKPGGHYSQAVQHNGILYLSGQLPIDPHTGGTCSGGIPEQTLRVLENVDVILKAGGSNRDRVLKVTVYIADIALWDQVNSVYREFFGQHYPARTIVPTRDLHFGCLVEMDAIAAVAVEKPRRER